MLPPRRGKKSPTRKQLGLQHRAEEIYLRDAYAERSRTRKSGKDFKSSARRRLVAFFRPSSAFLPSTGARIDRKKVQAVRRQDW